MIIGLTGESGAGKSTAAAEFEKHGFFAIDCDRVARMVTQAGGRAILDVKKHFGEEVINADGSMNRKKVGDIVFADREKLDLLESILFPHILAEVDAMIARCGSDRVLLDAPTLFDAGLVGSCDAVVSLIADDEVRLDRIMRRDGITRDAALARFSSQRTKEFFRGNSDYTIDNSATEEEFSEKLERVIAELISEK